MNTQTESLKLALDFLMTRRMGAESVIDALQEALAQPEQEPVAVVKALPTGHGHRDMHYVECQHLPVGTKLYKSPPAQRQARSADTWVVPDFLTAHDPETPEYRNGWNDCRQLMMEMYKREIK